MKGGVNTKTKVNPVSQVNWLLTLGLFGGAFSAVLFSAGLLSATALPPECPGVLADYNVILGSSGDDSLKGTSAADFIYGNGGSDNIAGNGGHDCIVADGGNDNITALGGNDVIFVGGENNIINAGDGNNKIFSGAGRDNITTGAGDDYIDAGDGNNAVRSGAGNDIVKAGSGNDYINGGDGHDACDGGGGNNVVVNCEDESDLPSADPGDDNSSDNPPTDDTDSNTDDPASPPDDQTGSGGNTGDEASEGNGADDRENQNDNSTVPANDNNGGGGNSGARAGGGVPPIEILGSNLQNLEPGLVLITWQTNIPATSRVIYSENSIAPLETSPSYGYEFTTLENPALTTSHRVEIYGLETDKPYYFRAVSDVINSTRGIGEELVAPADNQATIILASAASHILPVVVADNPTLWAALTAAPNPAPIVRQRGVAVSDPSAANAFAVPEHDLALLFGVLPMTAGLFGFLIILVLIIAFTIWQISRREKEKINRTV